MRKNYWILLLAFLLNTVHAASQTTSIAASATTKISRSAFFLEEKPIEITLATDFKKMIYQKEKGVYQPATIALSFAPNDTITENIRLYARGVFRRAECNMPGIMLNFDNESSPRLRPLKKLKLVCGCNSTSSGEQLLLDEYLVYKMYNLLTDMSFKVRLVKVNYKDTRGRMKSYSQYAFFIEDIDDMAKRNKCKEVQDQMFHTEKTNREQMTLVTLFQYLIGNTDWSVSNFHNIKLMRSQSDSLANPYAIPYDFDFAGLVNAQYATPPPELGIEKVTERYYRGFTRTMAELQAALDVFRKQKENIYALIKNFELISKRERNEIFKYVEEFYDLIEEKGNVQRIFIEGARKD